MHEHSKGATEGLRVYKIHRFHSAYVAVTVLNFIYNTMYGLTFCCLYIVFIRWLNLTIFNNIEDNKLHTLTMSAGACSWRNILKCISYHGLKRNEWKKAE